VTVVWRKLSAQPAQVQNRIDPPQQMIGRNAVVEAKLIKQTVLPTQLLTHHGPDPFAASVKTQNHVTNLSSTGVLQQPRLKAEVGHLLT
jgi:hypothetical protein